jgi:hypothetical protein
VDALALFSPVIPKTGAFDREQFVLIDPYILVPERFSKVCSNARVAGKEMEFGPVVGNCSIISELGVIR